MQFAPPAFIEQAQLDFLGVRREEREVDALAVPGRAERRRLAEIDAGGARAAQADVVGSSTISYCGGR